MTQGVDHTEERDQALIEQLAIYVDEELSAEKCAQMQAHLVGCTRCSCDIALKPHKRSTATCSNRPRGISCGATASPCRASSKTGV